MLRITIYISDETLRDRMKRKKAVLGFSADVCKVIATQLKDVSEYLHSKGWMYLNWSCKYGMHRHGNPGVEIAWGSRPQDFDRASRFSEFGARTTPRFSRKL